MLPGAERLVKTIHRTLTLGEPCRSCMTQTAGPGLTQVRLSAKASRKLQQS